MGATAPPLEMLLTNSPHQRFFQLPSVNLLLNLHSIVAYSHGEQGVIYKLYNHSLDHPIHDIRTEFLSYRRN